MSVAEPIAVLSEAEKDSIRHHLGYLAVANVYTMSLGIPAAVQPQFMIEGAMWRILLSAYPRLTQMLCQLDKIESQVFCGSDLADVNKIGEIDVNPNRVAELAKYYKIAQQGLSNLLGCPANPWDMREWLDTGNINVPAMGS